MTAAAPTTSVSHTCELILLPSQVTITDRGASITKVEEDEAKLTTHLTAQKAPWSEIAGSYDLDVSFLPWICQRWLDTD